MVMVIVATLVLASNREFVEQYYLLAGLYCYYSTNAQSLSDIPVDDWISAPSPNVVDPQTMTDSVTHRCKLWGVNFGR